MSHYHLGILHTGFSLVVDAAEQICSFPHRDKCPFSDSLSDFIQRETIDHPSAQ